MTNYQLPSTYPQLSQYEQMIIIAKIIKKHSKLKIDLPQALQLSNKLLQIFLQFQSQEISINQLKTLPDKIENSEHWQNISKFLIVAYTEWINICKKIIGYNYDNISLDLKELFKTNQYLNPIIIAGILPNNKLDLAIFKNILNSKLGHVILPPIYLEELNYSLKNLGNTILYDFQYLFQGCNIPSNTVSYLGKKTSYFTLKTAILSEFLDLPNLYQPVPNNTSIINPLVKIKYIETDNQFEEAKLIAAITNNYLAETIKEKKKVLIISSSESFSSLIMLHLDKYQITYTNLLNMNIQQLPQINIITMIVDLISSNFNINKFINLTKTAFLISEESHNFEKIILKDQHKHQDLKQTLFSLSNDPTHKLYKWSLFILQAFKDLWKYYKETDIQFNKVIIDVLRAAQNLTTGKIWQLKSSKKLANKLKEIIKAAKHLQKINTINFSNILKELIVSIKLNYEYNNNANVTISDDNSAILLNADCTIISEFNDNNWPGNLTKDPWFNQSMRSKLGLPNHNTHYAKKQYMLYTILQKSQIFLTNAKITKSGRSTISRFIFKLQLLAINNKFIDITINNAKLINYNNFNSDKQENKPTVSPGVLTSVKDFPNTISTTSIEMLIKNPYSFYAKNILRLKPLILNHDKHKQAEFGILIHSIIHKYNESYNTITQDDPINHFLQIGKKLLSNYNYSSLTKTIWQTKLQNFASEFIEFDQHRRRQGFKIFSEQYGQITLNINNKKINIIAIADRIEYSDTECYIIDFKTGTTPNKKEIEQGIATQLIIESIILSNGGFKLLPPIIPNKIIYVKIATSRPFLELTETIIDSQSLRKHEQGLTKLLEYFIKDKSTFFPSPIYKLALKYNDYKHLARYLI